MGDYLLYNGSYYKNSKPIITADNRGLRYGDGLFETLRVTGEAIHFSDWHMERLFNGLHLLAFELPAWFTPSHIAGQVIALCKKNGHVTARARIAIVRGSGGLYDPENHFPNCIIQSLDLPGNGFRLNENGLVTGIYREAKKTMDVFSNIKSNNCQPYTMAALHAKKNKWNDALVLNTAGRICETTIANIFISKDQVLHTPPLQEGCVAGIIRRYLLAHASLNGFNIKEKEITVENLFAADEVFFTNAVKGICWVSHCGDSVYTNKMTTGIFEKMLKK